MTEQIDFIKNELQKFNLADAVIEQFRKNYMGITVKDHEDAELL